MNKTIIIKALNYAGDKAIKQHVIETKPSDIRNLKKMGVKQNLILAEFATLELVFYDTSLYARALGNTISHFNKKYAREIDEKINKFKQQVIKTMKMNGANYPDDYIIEVI